MYAVHSHTKKLTELSIKQREMLLDYRREAYERAFPPIRVNRPTPVTIPPIDLTPETPRNTPT